MMQNSIVYSILPPYIQKNHIHFLYMTKYVFTGNHTSSFAKFICLDTILIIIYLNDKI